MKSSKRLPFEHAAALNREFGKVVRVDGYAGGREAVDRGGVSSWHVNTDLGLYKLREALDGAFGPREWTLELR